MSENTRNQKFIRRLLERISDGGGFIEDIWIDREVKLPGAEGGEVCTARSYTGNSIVNLTELLKEDLRHSFELGRFTFRFVAANYGSGKTALLYYFYELITTEAYSPCSIVIFFPLSDLLTMEGSESFSVKLTRYLLAQTFLELLQPNFALSARSKAENILKQILNDDQITALKSTLNSKAAFINQFNECFTGKKFSFEEFFLSVVHEISEINSYFTFVYLIDELDELRKYADHAQSTRSVIRALIKRAIQVYESDIRLIIYMVGISEEVDSFIKSDPVLRSHVSRKGIITLVAGRTDEFEKIKEKITERIEGAYRGYPNFEEARREIHNIQIDPDSNYLRGFCQDYADKILVIHEKYFKDVPEKSFEGSNNQFGERIKEECQRYWKDYLRDSRSKYKLLLISDSVKAEDHTFNCYARLIQNEQTVAYAYGGARNYELLNKHFDDFCKQLKSANFSTTKVHGDPPDFAFIIVPKCSDLLKKKLDSKNIQLITSRSQSQLTVFDESRARKLNNNIPEPNDKELLQESPTATVYRNINTPQKELLIEVLKGTFIRQKTVDTIINNSPYKNWDDLVSRVKLTLNQKRKLQEKIERKELSFQVDIFLSHNSKDKAEIIKIAKQLKKRGVSTWIDKEDLRGGDLWQKELGEAIERSRVAVIFIGSAGLGCWQKIELDLCLQKFVSQENLLIIPVILSDYEGDLKFQHPALRLNQWIDLRSSTSNNLINHLAQITIVRYS
jgi:uncharacterized protein YciU (UPF0263 family)